MQTWRSERTTAGSKIPQAAVSHLLLAVVLATLSAFVAPAQSPAADETPPLQKAASFKDYTANTYFDPNSNTNGAYYEILKDHKRIYRQQATESGEKFVIGTLYDDDPDAKLVTMGADITGEGRPDLVISEWSGGANCCLTFHIFEIGPKFRKIGDIEAEFGDQGPHFVHLGKAPGLQIQIYDWTFANWHSDFADSPAPKVILQYKRGHYRFASNLMSTPSADMKDVAVRIENIRDKTQNLHGGSWPNAAIPPELWGTMLYLIYTGHRLVAWQVVDMSWPKSVNGKEAFVADFTAQLKRSPYWNWVAQLGT